MSSPVSALQFENILYAKKESTAYVTLNRPKVLNALNAKTICELRLAFEDARDDSAVHGVILTGAGDKAFAAGADIAEMANDTAVTAEEKTRRGQVVTELIENLGKPVIAAVNGFDFVMPDDVKSVFGHVMGHRLILRPESRLRKKTMARVLDEVVNAVPVPQMPATAGSR